MPGPCWTREEERRSTLRSPWAIGPASRTLSAPFPAKDDDDAFHWRKEVQTWDLARLFSTFGETKGGNVCRHCRGFWRGGKGSSRFLMITEHKGKSAQLQLIFG